MLEVILPCQPAIVGPIGVHDTDLVAGLHPKYLTGEDDMSRRLIPC